MTEPANANTTDLSRRQFIATAAAGVALGAGMAPRGASARSAPRSSEPIELVHWSWLEASDGEVWSQSIDAFNEAHPDQGIQIKLETFPFDEYQTKVLAGVATGNAPDFGWGTGGLRAQWIADGVLVPMDDLAADVGLDLADFTETSLATARYPKFDNQMYLLPMDAMSLQAEINLDHVAEAGLDPDSPPKTGDEFLQWATAMTVVDGDRVTRSGMLMTGSGVQPTVVWGIIAAQMGFRRASGDLTEAAINPQAGKDAMQWVLDLFDTRKVSTRDVTDRYAAFGNGEGSMFWTGPWTINGYVESGLNFASALLPQIGSELHTYYELGGLEMYTQRDTGRYAATMEALKWLSDNSFVWTTSGRGAATRTSILEMPDYETAGFDPSVRQAFLDGMAFADLGPVPVLNAPDFEIYSGDNILALAVAGVLAGEKSIDDAFDEVFSTWQDYLDEG